MANMREQSKKNWTSRDTSDDLKLGCLQRIADSTERMGVSFVEIQESRDRYKRWYEEERERVKLRDRQIAGLRGAITRLKRNSTKKGTT